MSHEAKDILIYILVSTLIGIVYLQSSSPNYGAGEKLSLYVD